MKKYPAIALLEISGIATGIYSADAMIKRAPITVIKSGTVHNGKYLILIGGSVASVEESFYEGLSAAGDEIIDHVILPDVHEQVHDAILGKKIDCEKASIGIIETASVAAIIQSTDAAIKETDINVVEIRIADHLGGKAFSIVNGNIEDVQIAVETAREKTTKAEFWLRKTVIPNLHSDISSQIAQSTYFEQLEFRQLEEGEIQMFLGKVIGTLTPAIITPGLEGVPLLLVQPLDKNMKEEGRIIVACDSTRMAAPKEIIYYEGGREAALALEKSFVPVDHTIIGIVDDVHHLD